MTAARAGRVRRLAGLAFLAARFAAAGVALGRLARAARVTAPVRPTITPIGTIGVVVPARDEAERIGPLLRAIVGAPGVDEVIVVDDQSRDATAELVRRSGARLVTGRPLPPGWAGKAWALQQGIEAASSEWLVTLDADTRPDPLLPTALVARALGDQLDVVTVAGRFECPTSMSRWLHASMLTTLVYRFGPPGTAMTSADRTMANGQCMAVRRAVFVDAGGMSLVAGEVVEDIALARRLAHMGWRVGFLDATDMLCVRMFESLRDTWRGWGRSLALPGVERRCRQVADLAVVVLAQALPLPLVLTGNGHPVDVVLAAVRVGTLVGTRRAYDRADVAYWLSPLADPLSAIALASGITRGTRQTWRGREYSGPPVASAAGQYSGVDGRDEQRR